MEAARVAALRGHDVHLFEREAELGGLLNLACLLLGKDVLERLRQWQILQLVKTGVDIRMGTDANAAVLNEISPDAVVVATGSKAVYPRIGNIDAPNITTYSDVLRGKVETGDTVAIVGGGRRGCETADFLAKRGRRVTIVEMLDALMEDAVPSRSKQTLVDELAKDEVQILVNTRAERAMREGLEVTAEDGTNKVLIADSVVLAARLEPDRALYEQLQGAFPAVYRIGDCVECGLGKAAIHQAYEVAYSL